MRSCTSPVFTVVSDSSLDSVFACGVCVAEVGFQMELFSLVTVSVLVLEAMKLDLLFSSCFHFFYSFFFTIENKKRCLELRKLPVFKTI
jgi:hypothetical protein